ncbi:MAG: cytochrome b/b6 domain-containing protein [Gammaproteobacteria bacterium]|nr:cytochrome b/b6 domain-containing protein [Gammaproteobacteria bacterium]
MCLDKNKNNIDVVVRVFHWLLVILFVMLFITGNGYYDDSSHILLGYLLTSLIISRITWGLIGVHNALWKNYLYAPKSVFDYLSKLIRNKPIAFKVHNPAGSMMVLIMLLMLIMISVSGLLAQGLFELDGAFYVLTQHFSDSQAFLTKSIHDDLSQLMLFAVIFHISGVVYSSKIYNINLLLMMLSGKQRSFQSRR